MDLKKIRIQWEELQGSGERLRMRDAAERIGCTEAELMASGAGSDAVWRLDIGRMAGALAPLVGTGSWMWLVRNEAAVLEKEASGVDILQDGSGFVARGSDFSVSVRSLTGCEAFYVHGFARLPRSLQIFDPLGVAVLKLYWKSKDNPAAADAVVEQLSVPMPPHLALADDREESFAAPATPEAAPGIPANAYGALIEWAQKAGESIELTAGNTRASMSVSLTPRRLQPMNDWFNILDPGFNLHLQEKSVVSARAEADDAHHLASFFDRANNEIFALRLPLESQSSILS